MKPNIIGVERKEKGSIVRKETVTAYQSPGQKRQLKILLWVGGLIVLLGAMAYFFIIPKEKTYTLKDYQKIAVRQGDLIQTTQASGAVAVPVQLKILSPENGYAKNLLVKESDPVTEGQVLAVLEAPDLDDQLEDLQLELRDAERNFEKFRAQNIYTMKKLEREIFSIEKDINDTEEEIAKLEELVKINATRQSELDGSKETLEDLRDQKEESESSLEQEKTLQAIDGRIHVADIDQLEIKIKRLLENKEALSVRSPMDGEILELESSLGVPGSVISANMSLFTISDPGSAIVELEVLEDYAGLLFEGQEISLTIGGETIGGNLVSIGNVAEVSSDGLGSTILVKVKPRDDAGKLLLGSSVVGIIELGKTENAFMLPRGPYLTTGSQKYLYKVEGKKAVRIEVTFGEIQGNTVEIINGVAAGDEIITSGYQNFIEFKEIRLGKGD